MYYTKDLQLQYMISYIRKGSGSPSVPTLWSLPLTAQVFIFFTVLHQTCIGRCGATYVPSC